MFANDAAMVAFLDFRQLAIAAAASVLSLYLMMLVTKGLWQFTFLSLILTTSLTLAAWEPLAGAAAILRLPAILAFTFASLREWLKIGTKEARNLRPPVVRVVSLMLGAVFAIGAASIVVTDYRWNSLLQLTLLGAFILCLHTSISRWGELSRIVSDVRLVSNTLMALLLSGVVLLPFGLGFRGERFAGIFSNPNTTGLLAATVVASSLILWNWGQRYSALAGIIVGTITLFGTQSRTSIIALAIPVALGLLLRRKETNSSGLVGAAFALFLAASGLALWVSDSFRSGLAGALSRFNTADEQGPFLSGREEIWKRAFEVSAERPILGYGYGNAPPLTVLEEQALIVGDSPVRGIAANSYIQILVETGIFGLAIVAVVVSVLLWQSITIMARAHSPWVGTFLLTGLLVQITESPLLAPGQSYPWAFWFISLAGIMSVQQPRIGSYVLAENDLKNVNRK
ncbi:O-antigen ligase family protein [Dietzia maris]